MYQLERQIELKPMREVTLQDPIGHSDLAQLALDRFGDFVKAVVDVRQCRMVVGEAMHVDEEQYLLESGSEQADLWGINLYPEFSGEDQIEFDSMINLRPTLGNRTRGVDDPAVQVLIREVVSKLIR